MPSSAPTVAVCHRRVFQLDHALGLLVDLLRKEVTGGAEVKTVKTMRHRRVIQPDHALSLLVDLVRKDVTRRAGARTVRHRCIFQPDHAPDAVAAESPGSD